MKLRSATPLLSCLLLAAGCAEGSARHADQSGSLRRVVANVPPTDAVCVRAEVTPDAAFNPSHIDISQSRTWLDPEYLNSDLLQTWGSREGEIFSSRITRDGRAVEESIRKVYSGEAKANARSQPDFGQFAGGVVNSFSVGGKAYVALRDGDDWRPVSLVEQGTGRTDFGWVWPSASPSAASYMFLYERNTEFRLGEVVDFRTGEIVDWGSLGFRNVDGPATPGGFQSLATPRFVPESRRLVSPVVADRATGRTEIRLYEIPLTRPADGVLPYTPLQLSIFDEVNAFRAADWPGKTVLVSHSADQRAWQFRLLDHNLPIDQVEGNRLPIVQTITNPDPEIWGTSIRNSEPIEIGDRSFFMFISKEAGGAGSGIPIPDDLGLNQVMRLRQGGEAPRGTGVNHLWIAEVGAGKTWVRKVDDIPAGGNGMFITDPEWAGGGEVLTAFDLTGRLYAFPTGITVRPCQ